VQNQIKNQKSKIEHPAAFPKAKRLTSNPQFKAVLDRGRRTGNSLLTLYVAPNECGHPRLGVSVGKSSGNSVVRNRLKRVLREAFRRNQDRIPPGFDYVLMIAPGLSRKLKQPEGGAAALRGLGLQRMQQSVLSLVETAVRTSPQDPNRTPSRKRTSHE
jgi:ribonuclease P protein component